MTQIEEINKLYSKSKEYLIPKVKKDDEPQAKLTVYQMELDNMSVFNIKQDAPMNEVAEVTIKMIAKSLHIEEDDAKKVSFEHMQDLIDAIMDINNLQGEDKNKMSPIKKFLDKKNAQITKEKELQD